MEASSEDIMDALKTQYDDITETEALLSELFSTTQGEKESVAEFGGQLHSIAYKIRQSQGDKVGRNDDEFVQQNFFWGLKNDAMREALRPQLDQHESFNALLKEAQYLESDYKNITLRKQEQMQSPFQKIISVIKTGWKKDSKRLNQDYVIMCRSR